MTQPPGPGGIGSYGLGPNGEYFVLDLSGRAKSRMLRGAFVAFAIAFVCLIAIPLAVRDGSANVAGVVVFVVLGLFFGTLGAFMAIGHRVAGRQERQRGAHRLVLDRTGFRELGTEHGEIFVPWTEFDGIDVVAKDAGAGYNPYTLHNAVPRTPNTRKAMGLQTAVRMYPAHADEFAHRVPFYVTANSDDLQQLLLECPFGRVYYTEYDMRHQLLHAINRYTDGRLGEGLDETSRNRFRGSQF